MQPWLREDHMCFGNSKRINQNNMIDRVIVIAPRSEIVRQRNDFKFVTGRHMMKVTSSDDIDGYEKICVQPQRRRICKKLILYVHHQDISYL